MKELDLYSWIAFSLVIIGGINWGLYGLTGGNLLQYIFGPILGRILFVVVGGGAGYLAYQTYLLKFKKA